MIKKKYAGGYGIVLCCMLAATLFSGGCKSTDTVSETQAEPAAEPVTGTADGSGETSIFSSNDWLEYTRDNTGDYGYFFTAPQTGPFSMIEIEFKKLGGYEKSAFGFVFSYAADDEGWLSDYMRFEINTAGEFGLYSFDGSVYTDLAEEQEQNQAFLYENDVIHKGYDTANTLKLEENGDGSCSVFINGTQIAKIPLAHGKIGKIMPFFSVGKEDQEKLPEEPVTVTYRVIGSVRAE